MSFHGCDKSSVSVHKTRSGQITVSTDTNGSEEKCPMCQIYIVPNVKLSVESHVIMDCHARSKAVTRNVARMASGASESDMDAMFLIRMEIESIATQDSLSDHPDKEDSKYPMLSENYTRNVIRDSVKMILF